MLPHTFIPFTVLTSFIVTMKIREELARSRSQHQGQRPSHHPTRSLTIWQCVHFFVVHLCYSMLITMWYCSEYCERIRHCPQKFHAEKTALAHILKTFIKLQEWWVRCYCFYLRPPWLNTLSTASKIRWPQKCLPKSLDPFWRRTLLSLFLPVNGQIVFHRCALACVESVRAVAVRMRRR